MSKKDQTHHHKWQLRVRDWLIVPHSRIANRHDVTPQELAKHNTEKDCWVCINGMVYDCTRFLSYHPGGTKIITNYAGFDCTSAYDRSHTSLDPSDVIGMCEVGRLVEARAGGGGGFSGKKPLDTTSATAPVVQTDQMVELAKKSGLFSDTSQQELERAAAASNAGRNQQKSAGSSPLESANDEADDYGAVFDMLDSNKNGVITKEQFSEFLQSIDTAEEEIVALVAGCADEISKEEFVKLFE